MNYKALYRKWRPRVFEEVLGQEHVVNTLKNQILKDNIGHAYLFSGIRGTGKTSTAKIFARAINCLDSKDGNPCNECENCKQALADNAIDIIEIDAASNNGVDDIRDLREKTKYSPSNMRYKVYIIDEVHMLSIGAFNALLKTLEEPPSYVVFIFATTEIHKIPDTIISRCQKYELKRIQQTDIIKLLSNICDESNFTYDVVALEEIARMSDGAARDSLSILDQCFAGNESNHIDKNIINEVLGLVTDEIIYNLVDGINKSDSKFVLMELHKIITGGKDIKRFINQMISYYRNLMLAKISTDASGMIKASEEMTKKIEEQSKETSLNLIIRGINILTKVEVDSKWSSNARVILEVGLIKILQPDLENSIEALSERIEKLENNPTRVITTNNKVVSESTDIIKNVKKEIIKENVKEEKIEVVEEEKEYADAGNLNLNNQDPEDLWEDVLEDVRNKKISAHALIIDGKFEGIIDNCICISYGEGYGFHMIAVEKKENRILVEESIEKVYGSPIRVKYVSSSDIESDAPEKKEDSNEEKIKDFLGNHSDMLEIVD